MACFTNKVVPSFFCLVVLISRSGGADALVADPVEKPVELKPQGWKDIEALVAGDVDVHYAEFGGPFVCLGRNTGPKDARQIWSLADQKLLGTIAGKYDIDKLYTLSPDGKFFVAARGFANADKIAVFDQKGKPFAELRNTARIDELRFLADGRLAAIAGQAITYWNIPQRKPVAQIKLPRPFTKPSFSPNGKYVLIPNHKTIEVLDTEGRQVAAFSCPKVDDFLDSTVAGIAYNSDGRTAAIYLNSIRKQGFAILDMLQGEFKGSFAVDELQGLLNDDTKPIDWSIDGKAVLLRGRFVADPESGKVLWSFPELPSKANRMSHTSSVSAKLFAINQGIYPGESNLGKIALKAVTHEEAKIEQMLKAARSGAQVTDAALPKLSETTFTNAAKVPWPTTVSNWSVKPDLAGETSKMARGSIILDTKADHIDQIEFTPPPGHRVFVELRPDGPRQFRVPNQPDKSKSKAILVYDTVDGLRSNRIDFAFSAKFRAASPDGKLIALTDPENGDRIDVFDADKSEAVCAFRPFISDGQTNHRVTLLRFVDNAKILAGNSNRLVVFSIPECKAEVQLSVKPFKEAFSPNSRLLAIADNDSIRIVDSNTLVSLGDLPMPLDDEFTRRDVKAAAFSHDGKSLALFGDGFLRNGLTAGFFATWDLTNGELLRSARVDGWMPSITPTVEFAGPDHLLVNNTLIISLPRNELIWTLRSQFHDRHAVGSPDGRHWYVTQADVFKGPTVLAAADVLDPRILDWVKRIDQAPVALWKPGTSVRVDVQIQGGEREKAQQALEAALSKRGMKVAPDSMTTLAVTTSERATGKSMQFRDLMPGLRKGNIGEQTVNIVEVTGVATLSINGNVIWRGQGAFSNTAFGIVRMGPNETDVAAHLNKSMWNYVTSWAGAVTPPRLIVQSPEGNLCLPGTATLTAKGIEVQPPVITLPK